MEKFNTGLQDGMLSWYQSQTGASDTTVELRLGREPFDYRDIFRKNREWGAEMRRDAKVAKTKDDGQD